MIQDINQGKYNTVVDRQTYVDITVALEKMSKIIESEMNQLAELPDIKSAIISDALNIVYAQVGRVNYGLLGYVGRRFIDIPQSYREIIESAVEWCTDSREEVQ